MTEPLTRLLHTLPPAELDAARAERIRMRCRAQLARQAARAPEPRDRTVQVWQPLIAVLGIAYLAEVIVQALRAF